MAKSNAVAAMKAGSFRDSVAKTVRLLTRDQVRVIFRGFQPCVMTSGDKVIAMVLPEINDNAPPELIEAIQGFLDHECGHIFFTPFKRAQEAIKNTPAGEQRMRKVLLNIVEDIRLEKLLPRQLPGTKDNLERMYEAVMDKFFGRSIQEHLRNGSDAQTMMGACIVVGFRAMAGQKAFMRYMDDHNLWQWMTPLTGRIPTLSKDLTEMETYEDVEKIVDALIAGMEPTMKQNIEDAMNQTPPEDMPQMSCGGSDEDDENEGDSEPSDDQSDEPQEGDSGSDGDEESDEGDGESDEGDGESDSGDEESDSGDAGDDEGNSSEGDEADEGDGGPGDDEEGDEGDEADEGDGGPGDDEEGDEGAGGDEPSDEPSDEEGGEGHGDGSGTDDGSDEEGGDCSSDEGDGEDDGGTEDTDEDGENGGGDENSEGKTNRSITDALKELEPTQRKVLYLHKNKKHSVTRIAEKMQLSEDEVKSLLGSARRSLAQIMTGR